MIPIVFCASLLPCDRAMKPAEAIWSRRKVRESRAGLLPRQAQAIKTISMVVKDGVFYYPSEVYPAFGITPFTTAPKVTLPVTANP